MTQLPALHRASPPRASLGGLPGLRVMRSTVFRTALASVLLSIGLLAVSMMLLRQASGPDGQYAIDLGDYLAAGQRLADGASPYAADMLAGPVDAQGLDRYRYPPLLAQVLVPLAGLDVGASGLLWLLAQAAAVFAAVWIGSGLGGASRTLERGLWCGVAAVYFLPVFDTLWKGNVSGFLALACVVVGVGGAVAGTAAAGAALLKTVPATLLPVALAADRQARRTTLVLIVAALSVSVVLSPTAWLDYPTVLLHMLRGSVAYAANLAPAAVVEHVGGPATLAASVRIASLVAALLAVVTSVLLARTREGLPAAALLGTLALLLLPGSLWYHYLVLLLPFAAAAWPRAGAGGRLALFASAALVSLGLVWLPLALLGGMGLALGSLVVLWPTGRARSAWRIAGRPA